MSDTGKERRWPEGVWLAQIKGVSGALHIVPDESLRSEQSIETAPCVPETALAKARKEGREEVRDGLLTALAPAQCSGFGIKLSAIRSALDSLTKEGD